MSEANYHGCVVNVYGFGVLIEGSSGSGKTSLALGLVERAKMRNWPATLVADDQSLISVKEGKLFARVPDAIAGKAEIRGYGITMVDHEAFSEISVVARMVNDEELERMPEPSDCLLLGIKLPLLAVPRRHEEGAARIILSWIADRL